jgi:beta-glucosidase-like glycosyl hydrolase
MAISSVKLFPVRLFFVLSGGVAALAPSVGRAASGTPSYAEADVRAHAIETKMSLQEKIDLISGYQDYYIKGFPQYGLPQIYLSDATGGVNIRRVVNKIDKSTAFPAPVALAATWDPLLAFAYAESIGEECRICGDFCSDLA